MKERELLAEHVAAADIVVSTAAIPGTRGAQADLRRHGGPHEVGSVIVDLAAATGGNCELTKPGGDYVTENAVTISGPSTSPPWCRRTPARCTRATCSTSSPPRSKKGRAHARLGGPDHQGERPHPPR